jgi:hypothetical protein
MAHHLLGFLGDALVALVLVAFIIWQGREALKEYRSRKSGKSSNKDKA